MPPFYDVVSLDEVENTLCAIGSKGYPYRNRKNIYGSGGYISCQTTWLEGFKKEIAEALEYDETWPISLYHLQKLEERNKTLQLFPS
jgi:hypothetical protein